MSSIRELLDPVTLPKVAPFRQTFDNTRLGDIPRKLTELLESKHLAIKPGARVAITGGSRGIDEYAILMKTIVDFVKSKDGIPFIVPAMGSHGGGVAEAQTKLLNHLGITEEAIGAPIVSSMEVLEIGKTDKELPVYLDKNACEADGVILLNRIKCHTGFHGSHESGLVKMMAIGLAKHKGAEATHRLRMENMATNIVQVGRIAAEYLNIICGVGSIENGYGQVADVFVLNKDELWTREPEILLKSKEMMPRIYLDKIDTLIVKWIGKEFSGACLDPNVIGRYSNKSISGGPDILSLGILNLTKKSAGNAIGLGLTDYMNCRIQEGMNTDETYINAITSLVSRNAMIPMALASDKLVFQICTKASGKLHPEDNILAIIGDTKHLDRLYMSQAAYRSIASGAPVEQVGEYEAIPFDESGALLYFNNYA